jgi:hypothetical protein
VVAGRICGRQENILGSNAVVQLTNLGNLIIIQSGDGPIQKDSHPKSTSIGFALHITTACLNQPIYLNI